MTKCKNIILVLCAALVLILLVNNKIYAGTINQNLSPMTDIDFPKDNSNNNQSIFVGGWALNKSGVKQAQILIDGKFKGNANIGISRPDVKNVFPAYKQNNSGYSYTIDFNSIGAGRHTLTVQAIGNDGTSNSNTINININKPAPKMWVETPQNGDTALNEATITGWSLNASKVSSIDIFVDGNKVGNATLGISRPDVYKVFAVYNNRTSGFTYKLNTSKLSYTDHTITVKSNGIDGSSISQNIKISKLENITTIDSPKSSIVNWGVNEDVKGWALNPSGVKFINILLDNKQIGKANIGDSRPDVAKVFPKYNNTKSGYHYSLSLQNIKDGNHKITVQVIGNDGIISFNSTTVYIQSAGDYFKDLTNTINEMSSTINRMTNTINRMTSTINGMTSIINTATRGINTMVNGVNTANKGINTMVNGVNTANKGMNGMVNGVNTANKGMNGMVNGVNTANKGMNGMVNGVNTANKGMNGMVNGVNTANKGMNTMINGVNTANKGMNGMVNGVNTANKGMNTMINGVNTANKGMNTMINGVNTANKGMNDTNKSVQYINDSLDKLDENLTMVYLLNNNMININHEYIAQSPQSTNQLQGFVDGLNEAVVSNIDGITGLFSTPPEQTVKQTIQAIKNRKKIYQAINQQFFKEVIAGTDYTNAKFAGRLYGETFIFLATGGSSDVEKLNTITNLDKLENLSKLERVDNLADLIKKKSLGLGSTGRTVPKTLEEQLYMKEVLADPMHDATSVPIKMTDAGRWEDKDGWVKMQRIFKSSDKNQKNITIHFVYNTKTRQFDDFKFK